MSDTVMAKPIMTVRNLNTDFSIAPSGLTLVYTGRESRATTLALKMAGRMRLPAAAADAGEGEEPEIALHLPGEAPITGARQRARHIAMAGVEQIDMLDRLVPVRTVVRETLAWAGPWWARVPGDIRQTSYQEVAEGLGLDIEPEVTVGNLPPLQRFLLRCVLALLTRPDAAVLIVDDIDQIRSMRQRREILDRLHEYSTAKNLPIVVFTVNHLDEDAASAVINLQS